MDVVKITTKTSEYYCKYDEFDIDDLLERGKVKENTIFELIQMSKEEYESMITTQDANEFFYT